LAAVSEKGTDWLNIETASSPSFQNQNQKLENCGLLQGCQN
jgi:hypothetical protein